MKGRDLDRLLKGRFFQALHPQWQRKLGAPKLEETFQELYDRARILEQREKQYAESAAIHEEGESSGRNDRSGNRQQKGGQKKPPPSSGGAAGGSTPLTRVCYNCQQPGHISLSEASSRKLQDGLDSDSQPFLKGSSTGDTVQTEEISTSELERMLAERRLSSQSVGIPMS